jgi:manganese-dependent inorganic pyrophosphatase
MRGRGYSSVIFSIVDIRRERTTLLVDGQADALAETYGGKQVDDNAVHLPGILSRKKDLVPHLSTLADRLSR